jgi:hypothetical protein
MAAFTPTNSLEIELRKVLQDKHTPLWNFYTPLAASPLWVIVRHYPELDGSEAVAPSGQNPELCTFNWEGKPFIGLFTAPERAEVPFVKWELPKHQWRVTSAPGYQLLLLLRNSESTVVINLGNEGCRFQLDPDMVELLLERPEPKYHQTAATADFKPEGDPEKYLQPLRDFLAQQTNVRAAWISAHTEGDRITYQIGLVMRDPEDNSLLDKVCNMAKALTPVEMEWNSAVLMADDGSLRRLADRHRPFYQATDFPGAAK